jgi:hypothetical protein
LKHDCDVEPGLDLPVGAFRERDRAGLGDSLQPRGDIDAVAHQVTVALLDYIANMNANPEFDTAILRYAGVAADHRVLHCYGAAHGINHAAELDESSVARSFEHTPVMYGDCRIDEIAAQSSQPRQGTILINARQPAESGNVGGEDCRKFAFFDHSPLRRPVE